MFSQVGQKSLWQCPAETCETSSCRRYRQQDAVLDLLAAELTRPACRFRLHAPVQLKASSSKKHGGSAAPDALPAGLAQHGRTIHVAGCGCLLPALARFGMDDRPAQELSVLVPGHTGFAFGSRWNFIFLSGWLRWVTRSACVRLLLLRSSGGRVERVVLPGGHMGYA